SVKVVRTRTFEFERLGRAADGLLPAHEETPDAAREAPSPARAAETVRPRPRRESLPRRGIKALAAFVQRHVLVPDPQIAWIPSALVTSLSLIRKERVDLIYSSSPPNSGQVLALILKRLTKRPWIADFRDPWTEGIRRKQAYAQSRVRGLVE